MQGEETVRIMSFLGALMAVALWEVIAPRRALTDDKLRRWCTNLSMVAIGTVTIRVLVPVLPVGIASVVQMRQFGLLALLSCPIWLKIVIGVVALDFAIYLQHVLFHFVPVLWRVHRMHHTDLDIDVTTGNRFHPLELLISIGFKLAAVTLIGAPPLAVVIFETILNASSQFNHGNIRLPLSCDRFLRLILVTPDMHRVHHSTIPRETNSNFGFNLPVWDRICGTYRAQPEAGHIGMTIGLKEFRNPKQLTLRNLLVLPFRGKSS